MVQLPGITYKRKDEAITVTRGYAKTLPLEMKPANGYYLVFGPEHLARDFVKTLQLREE